MSADIKFIYKIVIEFPVTFSIKNNEDPFIVEGKGWFADELINWKIVMSEKTGIKTWLGGDDYAKKKIILEGLGEYPFLAIEQTGGSFLNEFIDNEFIDIGSIENKFIQQKTYLYFKDES